MLIVLASGHDASAASLVRRWRGHHARLLSPTDLSQPGWHWQPGAPSLSTLVLEGDVVPASSIRGCVSLLSAVSPAELRHIDPSDRDYIASEMTAFLLAWLSSLPGRLVNRPTPLCLTGPRLPIERWRMLASRVGLPLCASKRHVRSFANRQPAEASLDTAGRTNGALRIHSVPLVASRCLLDSVELPEQIVDGLQRLSTEVKAGLLTATLERSDDQWQFVSAAPTVDVTRPDVADAILTVLEVAS